MASSLKRVRVAPKGMGLNHFVALQEAFFAAEGLDVEFDWKTFRGTQSSWKGLEYFQRPQDRPYTEEKQDVVQGACLWGTICNASAGMGRVVTEGYGDSPWAIFVRPESKIRKPEDLKDVPVSVGMRAGSHFNVPYRLEKYLPLEHIKTVNTGGFGARLKALLDGEVEAASLLPPQIVMAEQLGLRKIIEDRFKTLWWVPDSATPEVVHGYMRALDRAEQALKENLAKYLPLWKLAVPAELETFLPLGFQQIRPGQTLRQRDTAARRVQCGVRAGRALGARPISQGPQPGDAFPIQPDYGACGLGPILSSKAIRLRLEIRQRQFTGYRNLVGAPLSARRDRKRHDPSRCGAPLGIDSAGVAWLNLNVKGGPAFHWAIGGIAFP